MENNLTPEQVVEKLNSMFNEKMEGTATKSDVSDLKNEVDALKGLNEKSAEVEKAIARMEGRLEAMSEKAAKNTGAKRQTLSGAFAEKHSDIIESVQKGQTFNLSVKALGDTTLEDSYDGRVALSTLELGVDRVQRPIIKVRNVVNSGTTTSKYVVYITQTNAIGADWTNEAAEKTLFNPTYEEVSEEVKKVAGTIKISKEMLADLAFIQSEINTDLMEAIASQIEDSLINGAGGAEINGLLGYAQTFAAGTFAGTIINANETDVIRVAIAQIQAANFEPTHVVLNPNDVAKMQLTKTSSGEYTYPMFLVDAMGVQTVANLPIVSTTNIAAGTFLVGDMTKSNVRVREDVNMQVGYVNDDFQRNMVTILAEARLVHYVKANQVFAFVTGDFATAKAAIND
jgi:HK97 family phage major capsid protein